MNSIKILATGMYLPNKKIENDYFNKKFNLDNEWIYQRTGIKERYWSEQENLTEISIMSVRNLIQKNNIDIKKVGLIIVASSNFEDGMPGVSFNIQKEFNIPNCICMDILAGCSGYINGIDIARKYLETEEIEYALIIGAERTSKYIDKEDLNTAILLGDGAGATLLQKSNNKIYEKNIESIGQQGDILTSKENCNIYMDGKKVYKFATSRVAENINSLLKKQNIDIGKIKYIIPHQSNSRILNSIAQKIGATQEQMYNNICKVGNTFNASIPIALNEMIEKKMLKTSDIILLVGYGGGLNLGSILIEI